MPAEARYIDAHARVDALPVAELENLAFFGTEALVSAAHDGWTGTRTEDLEAHLEALVTQTPARLRAAGITPYLALGVHPAKIPWLGLEALLARLPALLGRPEVVAVGEVGLNAGGEREEEIFRRQIALAVELRLPLVVCVPERDRDRILRRTLAILRESDVPGEAALLVRVDARSIATIRALDYRAALGAMSAAEAAAVVTRHGPEGLLLASEMGEGTSDPILPSRILAELEAAGLSRAVIRRVARDNAVSFYGLT